MESKYQSPVSPDQSAEIKRLKNDLDDLLSQASMVLLTVDCLGPKDSVHVAGPNGKRTRVIKGYPLLHDAMAGLRRVVDAAVDAGWQPLPSPPQPTASK